ncbi:uncharacterized protein JCM6883_007559 [Sporobolomyces salmoneus]|uniref:uncharacterized protein n=1 Tax=Sporobolomyces salmoneus TaxID=183962 RepID=UPI00316C5153
MDGGSVSEDNLESTTKHLDTINLCDPPVTFQPSQATLLTLPPELLFDLFSHLPSSYVLPPFCSALLPFHRYQLYRSVTVNLYQFDTLQRTLQSNKALCGFVEDLTLNFHPDQNDWRSDCFALPQPETLRHLIRTLPNLKSLFLSVNSKFVLKYYSKRSDFADNEQLYKFSLRSCHVLSPTMLDWEELRDTAEQPITGDLDEEQLEPDVYLELLKRSDQSFGLRYLTMETEVDIHTILRDFPLSQIQLVAFTHSVYLGRLLQNIGQPLLLTNLSLFSFNQRTTNSSLAPVYLSRFPNLTHLALGGTAVLTSPAFYDSLSFLPLESLQFGPHSDVRAQKLIDVVSDESKLTSLKRLVLDNFDSRAPRKEKGARSYALSNGWLLLDWTPECSEEKVKELKELAGKLGIEIEEAEDADDYDEDDDEEDEYEAAMPREYEEMAGEKSEVLTRNKRICTRTSGDVIAITTLVWRFADEMGWPRNYGTRRNW